MGKKVTIRRNLISNLTLIIIFLSVTILLITSLGSRSAVRNLSQKIIKQTIEHAEGKLSGFFEPVAKELLLTKSFGEKRIISMNEPDRLRFQFKSIMDRFPQITSILIADDFGRDFMLLRQENKWLNRQMDLNNQARITIWNENNTLFSEETITLDYDPRKRPWYINATEKWNVFTKPVTQDNSHELLSWTKPYLFFTTKEPGTTVSIRFKTPDGSQFVIGFDILLEDIQTFTDSLEILNHGQFVILTTEDIVRIVSFSVRRYSGETPITEPVSLKTIDATGIPLIKDTMSALRKNLNTRLNNPIRFSSEGQIWWGASEHFAIAADQRLRMCVIVPESDLVANFEKTRLWIIVTTAAVLIISLIRTVAIADRYSKPIEQLASSSKRISKGDFTPDKPIVSSIDEILKLADSHEMMRKGLKTLMLLESDIRIAHEIQQKTFPEKLPDVPGFEIAGWSMPADETGGDTYDVVGYKIDPETNVVHNIFKNEAEQAILLLADATGHGLGPALSATQIRAMLRMGVHINPDILILIKHINEQLHADLPNGRFITAWLGQLDGAASILSYVSAGQAPLLYYKSSENSIDILHADTLPLGIIDHLELPSINQLKMGPGDIFAVISDGIFETSNYQNEHFGEKRVSDILLREKNSHPSEIIEAIRIEAEGYAGKTTADDDRTMIILKKGGFNSKYRK